MYLAGWQSQSVFWFTLLDSRCLQPQSQSQSALSRRAAIDVFHGFLSPIDPFWTSQCLFEAGRDVVWDVVWDVGWDQWRFATPAHHQFSPFLLVGLRSKRAGPHPTLKKPTALFLGSHFSDWSTEISWGPPVKRRGGQKPGLESSWRQLIVDDDVSRRRIDRNRECRRGVCDDVVFVAEQLNRRRH